MAGHNLTEFSTPSAMAAVTRVIADANDDAETGVTIYANADGRKDGGVAGLDWEDLNRGNSGNSLFRSNVLILGAFALCTLKK